MRQRLSLLATLAVLTAFSLAGCGGSGGGDKAASTEGSATVNATGASLQEKDYKPIDPFSQIRNAYRFVDSPG